MANVQEPLNIIGINPHTDSPYPYTNKLSGPYYNLAEALEAVPLDYRALGLVIGIITSGGIVEYWFKAGVTDNDLVIKSQGGGGTVVDNLQDFVDISPNATGNIVVDYDLTPYAKVSLNGTVSIFNLTIQNAKDGNFGKILITQTGFKQISVANNIVGTVDLPLKPDTMVLVSYNVINNIIYVYSNTVIGDIQFSNPKRIDDFQTVYYDSQTCIVTWTAPYGNDIYDKVTEYDMRYSAAQVNANDPIIWNGLSKVANLPAPLIYGEEHRFAINNLQSNTEYYFYIKSIKVNYGVKYTSDASDPAYCKTQGSPTESEGYYRLNLETSMLNPKKKDGWKDDQGVIHGISFITDEDEKNVFLEDGTPDTNARPYETFWRTPADKHANPWNFLIDLNEVHTLSTLYVLNYQKAAFRVFLIKDAGYEAEYVATSKKMYNSWEVLDLQGKSARYINLVYDVVPFADNDNVAVGEEVYPVANQSNLLGGIYKMFVYGRYITDKPNSIMPPARNPRTKRTMDEFLCTNGHFYQQGRIHHLCSGSHVRLYGSLGHFGPGQFVDNYQRIADYRVRTDKIPWVAQNNGTGKYLKDTIRDTYKPYGLTPFIAGTGILDYCKWQGYTSGKDKNKCIDNYWLPGAWKALPKRGVYGTELYLKETTNPLNYKTLSKTCNHILGVYGSTPVESTNLDLYPNGDPTDNGLDLMNTIEHINEPDATWLGWMWYMQPEECAAQLSAVYDGHCGLMQDEDGNKLKYGVKTINPNALVVAPGMAGLNTGYVKSMYLWCKLNRPDGKFPADVLNFHSYFSNIGNQGGDTTLPVQYAITCEESLKNQVGAEFKVMADFRNRYLSDKEIWITEFGYGECGGRETQSKYQCYTQAGRVIGNWTIPDRHRSEVKGAWILRAVLTMIDVGFDLCNYYSTEMESSYFDAGVWGSGAGYEMFHWNDVTDTTPGAKFNAIKAYEHTYARGGFALTGLFGPLLGCGGFPISRAYWWIATFRTRLKGYICIGRKYSAIDDRITVYCFRKPNEDKGAYVVYLNDDQNTGIPNVEIPVPDGISNVTKVEVFMPDLVSPETIPANWAEYDQLRTQFPTSRREKYINGQWVIQNIKPDNVNYESYSHAAGTYPDNPVEGDLVVTIPTIVENPYFPIVGPVGSKYSKHGKNPSAQEYEWIDPSDPVNEDGSVKWSLKYNPALAWRQVDAICDYVEHTQSGKHGCNGDESNVEVLRGAININVSEFPEFYFFDAVPDVDFKSNISDLSAVAINSTSVKLYWNNNNVEDTGYEIFVSNLPETGYSSIKEISIGIENSTVIAGLNPTTVYYFKMRPLCNGKTGDLSDYVSVKTYSFLPTPDGLNVISKSATSINLGWNYTDEPLSDFVNYSVYRAANDGNFILVGVVNDINKHNYEDSGLAVGTTYVYKVRAMGTNGKSDYSPEFTTRTSLAEEVPPVITMAMTDKIGTSIVLTFDLGIKPFDPSLKNSFTLTEDDNPRFIVSAILDNSDNKKIIIKVSPDSLSDYDKKTNIRISYTPNEAASIKSIYDVPLDAIDSKKVINVIGNFTDIEAIYKVNFTGTDEVLPTDDTWNNMIGNPELGSVVLNNIKDTYGRTSSIIAATVNTPPTYIWGGTGRDTGTGEVEGVEAAVYSTAWQVAYRALVTENIVARLQLSSLNPEHKYTIKAYGSWKNVNNDVPSAKIKCNGNYSNIVALTQNKTSFMIIEDCVPSNDGKLLIDFIPTRTTLSTAVSFNFIMIEEYKSNSEPVNNDIWLREATIVEDVDNENIVYVRDLHIYLNCVGIATHYKIYEIEGGANDVEWYEVPANMKAPYTISDTYGNKTLYVQVKNSYFESNTRVINVEYKDHYKPLLLNNIFINNNDAVTYNKNVNILVEKQGIPTHYKISESINMDNVEWTPWTFNNSIIPYTLSDTEGQKSVYVQLKDVTTESVIKVDTIMYSVLTYKTIILDVPMTDINVDTLNIRFAPLKYNKRFAYGITSDDTHVSAWNVIFKYFNGMWIDNAIYYHMYGVNGELTPRTTGAYAPRALTYTDGCGIVRRFPINVTVDFNPKGSSNPANAGGAQYPYLLYPEIKEIMEFDGDFSLHDVKDPALNTYGGTVENIVNGINEYQNAANANLGRQTFVMTEPNGDAKYTTGAEIVSSLYMITSARGGDFKVIDLRSLAMDYTKVKVLRQFNEKPTNGTTTWKNEFLSLLVDGAYYEFGCHGTDKNKAVAESDKTWSALSGFFDWICDTYGINGSDDIWFTTNGEVVQYKQLCKLSEISYEVIDNILKVTIKQPILDNFNWSEYTLLIDGTINGNIVESTNVRGLSYKQNSNTVMININTDLTLETRAEKYVNKYETSFNNDDKVSAEYFIQRLKPSLRSYYIDRITNATEPPILNSFKILATTETGTDVPNVSCVYATNEKATHYMISESSDFTDAAWNVVNSNIVDFKLSDVSGLHTVYFKVKNQFGESVVMSDTIQYTPKVIALTSISIKNRIEQNLTIGCVYQGIPTHYKVAETEAGIASASWLPYVGDITYHYSNINTGVHNVYVQLKDGQENVSVIRSTYFEIEAPSLGTTIVSFSNTTQYATRHELYNGKHINVTSGTTIGAERTPLQLVDINGNPSITYNINHNLLPTPRVTASYTDHNNPTITGNDKYAATYISTYWSSSGRIFESPLYFMFNNLVQGKYLIRIFVSSHADVAVPSNRYANVFYAANDVVSNINFDTTNNLNNYIEIANVPVLANGELLLKLSNNASMWHKPGLNLIEIIRTE